MTVPGPDRQPDPERVLAQALRAMAGGQKQIRPEETADRSGASGRREPLTVLQIVLISVILGLLVGMTIGLVSLLA